MKKESNYKNVYFTGVWYEKILNGSYVYIIFCFGIL